ncbi:MAG: NUDIX pyrophosphatase [Candidatus Thorarchaeota archaeon]
MKMRLPIQVLVYPVRFKNENWEFLLLRRTEERGGFWQGVTGHPEKKEKIVEGAKRELLEETSFIPSFIFQTDFSYTIEVDEEDKTIYPPGTKELTEYVFVARIDQEDDPTLDPYEHVEWKWCNFDEAIESLLWEENKEALKHVYNLLLE